MADFIDRAKLEAEAWRQWPDEEPSVEMAREIFMAGVDAATAALVAGTTKEWGLTDALGATRRYATEGGARMLHAPGYGKLVSRSALYGPWLPSEGGES